MIGNNFDYHNQNIMDYSHINPRAMSRVKLLTDRSPHGGCGGARAQSANMRLRKLSPRWRRVSISVTDRDRLNVQHLIGPHVSVKVCLGPALGEFQLVSTFGIRDLKDKRCFPFLSVHYCHVYTMK